MPSTNGMRRPHPALLAELRARIARLEHYPSDRSAGSAWQGDPRTSFPEVLPLGAPEIDAALPWGGLPRAALHEVIGEDGAASGFCAAVLARFVGEGGGVLWCRRNRDLYGPGLSCLGVDTERLIVVRGRTGTDVLWAMEEGLRSTSLVAVLGETERAAPIALRRLQLAAETSGVAALLLRPLHGKALPTPAVTRWRVTAAPGTPAKGHEDAGFSFVDASHASIIRWRVELLNCRGAPGLAGHGVAMPPNQEDHGAPGPIGIAAGIPGVPRSWLVEWRDGPTGRFAVAVDVCDRSPESAAASETRLAV